MLYLSDNIIDDKGVKALVKHLKGTHVCTPDLSSTCIDAAGVGQLDQHTHNWTKFDWCKCWYTPMIRGTISTY